MCEVKRMFLVVVACFALVGIAKAAAPVYVVYDNVTVALAGVRADGIISGNIQGSFGSKWIELDVNTATGKAMLAVMLTAISTEKTVSIYAAQDAAEAVFIINWMNISK